MNKDRNAMSNASEELADLMEKFQARAELLVAQFQVEATAIAWRIAAEQLSSEMPSIVASGSLSWEGKPALKAEMTVKSHRINVKNIIRGNGKIGPVRNGVSNSQKILDVLSKDGPMVMSELSKRIPGPSNATLRGLLSKMKSERKVHKNDLSMWTLPFQ
jgi:hypothetical protein